MKQFFKNIFSLVKVMAKMDINWNYLANVRTNAFIDKNAKVLGSHVIVETKIGFGTAIGPNAKISFTTIGKFCSLGPNLVCGWGIHPVNGVSTSPVFYSTRKQAGFTYSSSDKIDERKQIEIGNDVFIGANVTILDGVSIGDGAVIGAGAVVSKDIPPYAIAVGCPIKVVKYRFSDEIISELLEIKWWDRGEKVFQLVEKNFFNVDEFINELKDGETHEQHLKEKLVK